MDVMAALIVWLVEKACITSDTSAAPLHPAQGLGQSTAPHRALHARQWCAGLDLAPQLERYGLAEPYLQCSLWAMWALHVGAYTGDHPDLQIYCCSALGPRSRAAHRPCCPGGPRWPDMAAIAPEHARHSAAHGSLKH
jgi:hypothetical protein